MSDELNTKKPFSGRPVQFDDVNEIFDERGNMFLALRKIQWVSGDKEPDPSKAKYELRKWIVNENGEEIANKGFSFLTEDGPHNLVHSMINKGFGKTKEILKGIKDRLDFKDSVNNLYKDDDDNADGEFFDMRSALLDIDYSDKDTDDEE